MTRPNMPRGQACPTLENSSFPQQGSDSQSRIGGANRPTRFLHWLVALALLCVFSPSPASAAGGTGALRGRVFNVTSESYMKNVLVTIDGSTRSTYTDQAGEFRFDALPPGQAALTASYTGIGVVNFTVEIKTGETVTKDVVFRVGAAVVEDAEMVVLDVFTVASNREENAAAIASNEQRVSGNIKNVVSTDAFGQVNQGNIGEFLKHVPGVTIEYKDGNSASGIQVRGFGSNYTGVTTDGLTLASTALANTSKHTRQFLLEQASINNIARIEVVKLPTPDLSANLLGGAVNLVSKSAFERAKPVFEASAYFTGNSTAMNLSRTTGLTGEKQYRVLPSVDLSYICPLSKTLGFVLAASSSNQYFSQEQNIPSRKWTANGATVANPYTYQFRTTTAPQRLERNNISLKVDWKPADGHLVEITTQANEFSQNSGTRYVQYTSTTGQPAAWGETYTRGTAGAGAVIMGSNIQERHGLAQALAGKYSFTGSLWQADFSASLSRSDSSYDDMPNGFFSAMSMKLEGVSLVSFDSIDNEKAFPGQITVSDAAGNAIDPTNVANYRLAGVYHYPWSSGDDVSEFKANITRDLDFLPFSAKLKFGGATNRLERGIEYTYAYYDYYGADGVLNTSDNTLAPFKDLSFSGTSAGIGYGPSEYASQWLVYDQYRSHPEYFGYSEANQAASYKADAQRSCTLIERVSAGYAMLDMNFFTNRLRVLGGARYELTEDEGWGYLRNDNAIYVKDANGNVVLDAGGNKVRRAEAGAAGSLAEAKLQYLKRGLHNKRDYSGIYPSVHATFNITKDILLRFAYAKTIGRPGLSDIVPNVTVTEATATSSGIGTISSSNTELKPWTANNYDLALEYYLPGNNGTFAVGAFSKDITDFFGTTEIIADEATVQQMGLPAEYVGYKLSTRTNAGDARIRGWELSGNHPLNYLGPIGQKFSVFANYTKLTLEGKNTADFTDFIPKTGNVGVRFNHKRFMILVKMNYRGTQLRSYSTSFPGAIEYVRAQTTFDANAEYQLTTHFSVFATARNITNEPTIRELLGSAPRWSAVGQYNEYGTQCTLGVKGTF